MLLIMFEVSLGWGEDVWIGAIRKNLFVDYLSVLEIGLWYFYSAVL